MREWCHGKSEDEESPPRILAFTLAPEKEANDGKAWCKGVPLNA
jgi:hypothetical protein